MKAKIFPPLWLSFETSSSTQHFSDVASPWDLSTRVACRFSVYFVLVFDRGCVFSGSAVGRKVEGEYAVVVEGLFRVLVDEIGRLGDGERG